MEQTKMKRKRFVRIVTAALMIAMMSWLLPADMTGINAEAATTPQPPLQNPSTETNTSMTAGQKVTWDCVWFGSYPQREVVKKGTVSDEVIVDAELYSKLNREDPWDENDNLTLNGTKYHRYWYRYSDSYRYFRYDPIKWRVLNVNGSDAFLLADKALDYQEYHEDYYAEEDITWGKSTIRSWLNGYGTSENAWKKWGDYTKDNFINSAFTSSEINAIKTTEVKNDGDTSTNDKVFLLSLSEVCSTSYGFVSDANKNDEARVCKVSAYTKVQGACAEDSSICGWWLRTVGGDRTVYVGNRAIYDSYTGPTDGCVYTPGLQYKHYDEATRPAMHIDTSSAAGWSYAGTVSSDGTSSEIPNINNSSFTIKTPNVYDGKQKTPAVTVKYNGKALAEGTDYTVEYGTNTAVGKGQITIKGAGSYTGQANLEFDIVSSDISKYSVKLSGTSYTYNGKVRKPSVTVSVAGTKLSAANYKVKYSSGCKNVGKYKVTVTGKGIYKGTKSLYFKINPKATSISKPKKSKKSFKASWKKVSSQATGYQLQYALNSKFTKSKKTVTVKSYKTTSKTIKKLKAKKKYYVKVRTYKKVGKTTYYSSWSKTKTVTTK